jgi:Protein of unknown function (DUF3455)
VEKSKKSNVPAAIQPPADEEFFFVARASGFQIYICRPDAEGRPAWVLKAPEAQLFDQHGNPIGTHFGGPTWRHNDGSEITARLVAKVDAPETGAIPWLLLSVTGHSGDGVLSRVSCIQRIHTVAGLAPAAAECGPSTGEVEFKSPYSADYYFYARRA